MTGVVEGFRWAIPGEGTLLGPISWCSVVVTGVILVAGLAYFGRVQRTFADVI